ncbi:alpha/beta fold hydrolase [Telmatospirillum sp. J64-1]|uniref:alpha/beta fold hydrolase n=1 Tax=Telmatospirillum sp. J64-1 TaxID=2502183 RepID=UPI001C8F5B61|nr:alpha/beta hydrolase [Telmatospirillum sp. J64-1]
MNPLRMTRRRFLLATAAVAASAWAWKKGLGGKAASAQGISPVLGGESDVLRGSFVDVGDWRIHTLVSTLDLPPDAPNVVLVHGLGLSGQYMVPTAEALAPYYRVYVPDFPGFGDSSKPSRALDVAGMADVLNAWMPAVGLERAMLLGNSFGCQIIVELAARHPERVERAVLQGPTTPPEERSWIWQFIRWQQNGPNNPPRMEEIAGEDYEKAGLVRLFLTFQYSLNHAIEDRLPQIQAPMLVVRGTRDPICRQDWAERVAQGLPDGRLVLLPDVAHTLVYTSPQELAAVSRPFFDEA